MLSTELITTIEQALAELNFTLVQVKFKSSDTRKILEILIEKENFQERITIDDCKSASRYLSTVLDIQDIIPYEYMLEVSSAGVERPLVKLADYQRFLENNIKVALKTKVNGRERIKGLLVAVTPSEEIEMITKEGESYIISIGNIKNAKLIFTDEMFRKILNKK
jgi:ribosome maturation factor RimP